MTKLSAKHGYNLASLLPVIMGGEAETKPLIELDYEAYGLAEDMLGWFNGTALVTATSDTDFKPFAADFMRSIRDEVTERQGEIAHLKIYMVTSGGFVKASITSADEEPDFTLDNSSASRTASLVVNARISIEPDALEQIMLHAFDAAAIKHELSYTDYKSDCFKPGRPDPNARLRAEGGKQNICCRCAR